MNINRNGVKIVAAALLATAVTANAQLLGGGLTGGANGALGGGLGQIGGGGNASGMGNVGADGTLDRVRDRTDAAGSRSRDVGATSATAVQGKAQKARGGTQGAATASQAADGNASGSAERSVMGRTVNASGAQSGGASANRNGASATGATSGSAAVKRNAPPKKEPVATEPAAQ